MNIKQKYKVQKYVCVCVQVQVRNDLINHNHIMIYCNYPYHVW